VTPWDGTWLTISIQIIYTILGVPFEDLDYLTNQAVIRSQGSSNAREASVANQ
jgi:nitric oxide reductase